MLLLAGLGETPGKPTTLAEYCVSARAKAEDTLFIKPDKYNLSKALFHFVQTAQLRFNPDIEIVVFHRMGSLSRRIAGR
jgi:hypothetical protein